MFGEKMKKSLGLRISVLTGLTLLLLIPALMVQSIILERKQRRTEVMGEVTRKWGEAQTIAGPVLFIPIQYQKTDEYGTVKIYHKYFYLLPDSLTIDGQILPHIRYRGIYRVLLYQSRLNFSGLFDLSALREYDLKGGEIQFDQTRIQLGISDMKGINEQIVLAWNQNNFHARPGLRNFGNIDSGFFIKSPLDRNKNLQSFHFDLNLNGSEQLHFIPVGKVTTAHLEGNWQHPSFSGDFLPELRNLNDHTFHAKWTVLDYNRNFSQFAFTPPIDFDSGSFGVNLIFPVDHYQKSMRTVKYAIMFIVFTFSSFFLIEVLNRKLLHPIQYLLIGSALILFYILLLSISEHVSFPWAYLLSAGCMILVISFYSKAILQDRKLMFSISMVLSALYGFLYINLQLQDYALLLGSMGLLAILIIFMYLTRNIDWYSLTKSDRNIQRAAEKL